MTNAPTCPAALSLALLRAAPGPLTATRIASMADDVTVGAVQVELDRLLEAETLRRGKTRQGEAGYTLATR